MPPAARITDLHVCPKVEPGPVPHVGGPVLQGFSSVMIGYQPAARVDDSALCAVGKDSVAAGEPTVLIGYQQAARQGDATTHGGRIMTGFATVIIGDTPQISVLRAASADGAPFCEQCALDALAALTGHVEP